MVPDTAAIDARVRADIEVLIPDLNTIYLHLAYELQVKEVNVNGTQVHFSRYGDMSEAYMHRIAERACDALRIYETAFGPYPHRRLALVEYNTFAIGKALLKPNLEANCTITGCVIYDMITDGQDRVWIATDTGIARYDMASESRVACADNP